MHIETALDRYLQQLHADGRSRHTIDSARRYGSWLAAWLAQEGRDVDVRHVRHEDLAAFLAAPVTRQRPDGVGKQASTVNVLRSHLKAFFRFLHQAGYLRQDPSRLIRQARCGRPLPQPLNEAEQRRLLVYLGARRTRYAARDEMLVRLLLATGLRLGAALALEAADVDLERGQLLVRRNKGDQPQVVFLGPAILERLRGYLGGHASPVLFPARHGGRLVHRHVGKLFAEWGRRAGIGRLVSPHSLRHTFGQGLYDRTGDLLLVQRALGHRSIASTLVYAQCSQERLRQALSV